MTEKRFEIDLDEEAITDNGEYCLSLYCFQDKGEKDVCDLLNELAEENEKLKKENKKLQDEYDLWIYSSSSCEYDSLKGENERLKCENKNLKVTIEARDTLIEVCEKKFRELGFIITVDDDGYVIE